MKWQARPDLNRGDPKRSCPDRIRGPEYKTAIEQQSLIWKYQALLLNYYLISAGFQFSVPFFHAEQPERCETRSLSSCSILNKFSYLCKLLIINRY